MQAADLGIRVGTLEPGPLNAITDVPGVRVGHTTLIEGASVRTGVTVIQPHDGDPGVDPVYAGCHRLNGNGELTGLEWVRESGLLTTPIGITNTHSVGVVRDAIVESSVRSSPRYEHAWSLPVVGETWDGTLNDTNGFHVRAEHVHAALEAASGGPVEQGNVGGGTGMICHEFKGGIGTGSRIVETPFGRFVVGVLVQANYGWRPKLSIDGVPVGRELGYDRVPAPPDDDDPDPEQGSIIGIVATDAPLLPLACQRLALRAGLGMARCGGAGSDSSGDLFLAFATGNRGLGPGTGLHSVRSVPNGQLTAFFYATIEATEEAIVGALLSAETMTGHHGTVYALPHDDLVEIWRRHRPGT
jgi:D-aminopeptidase